VRRVWELLKSARPAARSASGFTIDRRHAMSFACWIARQPLILYHWIEDQRFLTYLPPCRIYRMLKLAWSYTADELENRYRDMRRLHPDHALTFLVGETAACQEVQARGVPAILTSHNSLVDERVHRILPEVPKRYDAIYVARMSRWKRHLLARRIPRLLVIGGVASPDAFASYHREVQAGLPQADFMPIQPTGWVATQQVTEHANSARVGLCLSAAEGAMYASIEYLLCGLPVVSTYNRGGRNEFLNPEYCRLVLDDPQAVADAVQELIDLAPSAEYIRRQTLLRMYAHRENFVQLVQNIFEAEGVQRDFRSIFEKGFYMKMQAWRRDYPAIFGYLDEDVNRLENPGPTDAASTYPPGEGPLGRTDRVPPAAGAHMQVACRFVPFRCEPTANWPVVLTLALTGPTFNDVWNTIEQAFRLQREQRGLVRIYGQWHGRPGHDLRLAPRRNLSSLVRQLLDELEDSPGIDVVEQARLPDLFWCEPPSANAPSTMRVRRRWGGWSNGTRRRLAVFWNGGNWGHAVCEQLFRPLSQRLEVVCLDERRPVADWLEELSASDLYVGETGGWERLAHTVGVPLLLVNLGLLPPDDIRAVRVPACWANLDELLLKVTAFLGLGPTTNTNPLEASEPA
jgi:glycosyltransferase involved in cell wall biosynthesis